jgi:hypothetical protein
MEYLIRRALAARLDRFFGDVCVLRDLSVGAEAALRCLHRLLPEQSTTFSEARL